MKLTEKLEWGNQKKGLVFKGMEDPDVVMYFNQT